VRFPAKGRFPPRPPPFHFTARLSRNACHRRAVYFTTKKFLKKILKKKIEKNLHIHLQDISLPVYTCLKEFQLKKTSIDLKDISLPVYSFLKQFQLKKKKYRPQRHQSTRLLISLGDTHTKTSVYPFKRFSWGYSQKDISLPVYSFLSGILTQRHQSTRLLVSLGDTHTKTSVYPSTRFFRGYSNEDIRWKNDNNPVHQALRNL
jgi:hypothetical protein